MGSERVLRRGTRWPKPQIVFSLAALIGLGCAAQSEKPAVPGSSVSAVEVFQLAGVDDQVRALAENLVHAAVTRAEDLAPETGAALIDAARAAAAEAPLLEAAEASFAERSEGSALLEPAERFLASDLGRRLRAFEEQLDTELAEDALDSFIDELFAAPVPIARVRLLERLALATRGAQIAADTEAIAARVIARAVARSAGGTDEALAQEMKRIDRASTRTAATLRAQSTVLMQYVYRDATDADLADYVAFAESPEGAWIVEATRRTLADLEPWIDARMSAAASHPE